MNGRLTSIVIVSYWSQETIAICLDAALASDAAIEVIVVDNGSGDDTCAAVQARIHAGAPVRLIVNPDNPGFAVACNQGAAQATGHWLLFLNPDAFIGAEGVAWLARILDAHPRLGLLGCRVVDRDGRPDGPQRRREPTWRRSLASASGLARFERRWSGLQGVDVPDGRVATNFVDDEMTVESVDAVNGSVMMLPTSVFRTVGGFDEGFRLHAEDLDLCRRVRGQGCEVGFISSVTVTHVGGVSSRRRPLWVEWQKTRSLWRYFRRHDAAADNPVVAVLVAFGLLLRYLIKLPVLIMRRWRPVP